MKVFVAGATGVLGRTSVLTLLEHGHEVTGVARTPQKREALRRLGANALSVDLFEPAAVAAAVDGHDAVCNFATRIPVSPRAYVRGRGWRMNDRLHREASRNLVDAVLATRASRFLQHSAAFLYASGDGEWLDETAELEPPPHGLAVLEAEAQAERASNAGRVGVGLRFGLFYGPAAPNTRDLVRVARLGLVPLPGDGDAYLSCIHTDDLGPAVVAALQAPPGVYNVVDTEPITRLAWARVLAEALQRKRVRPMPKVVSRILPKRYAYITRSQRVSCAAFRRATGWSPTVASSEDGWRQVIQQAKRRAGRP